MMYLIIPGLLLIIYYLIYAIGRNEERFDVERRELWSRIDALTTALARDKGIQIDLFKPRQVEPSEGWLDAKPIVTLKGAKE